MKKETMLSAMTSEGHKKCFLHYHMHIKKEIIQKAYNLYMTVSHTAGKKYLAEKARSNDSYIKGYQRKYRENN